jgi:hypothetical protein
MIGCPRGGTRRYGAGHRPAPTPDAIFGSLLALASRFLVLMYEVAICHPSTKCYAISGTLFPISGGSPALPVPSPAAISLLSLL